MMAAYACMGVIFAAPAASARFAAGRPQSLNEAFVKAARAAGYAESLALLMLAAGIGTVILTRRGPLFLPQIDTLAGSLLLGITATLTMALFTGWLVLRFSPVAAQIGTRLVLVLLLLGFFLNSQKLPELSLPGAVFCLGASALLAYLLRREVNPR